MAYVEPTNKAPLRMQSVQALAREIVPAGRCRLRVRGLAASNLRSTIRLKAMAQVRAVTMAIRISPNNFQPGQPRSKATRAACSASGRRAWAARAASTVAAMAKGRAKTVCDNFTKSAHFSKREGGRFCSSEWFEARFSFRATGRSCLIKGKMTSEEGRERRNGLQRP